MLINHRIDFKIGLGCDGSDLDNTAVQTVAEIVPADSSKNMNLCKKLNEDTTLVATYPLDQLPAETGGQLLTTEKAGTYCKIFCQVIDRNRGADASTPGDCQSDDRCHFEAYIPFKQGNGDNGAEAWNCLCLSTLALEYIDQPHVQKQLQNSGNCDTAS